MVNVKYRTFDTALLDALECKADFYCGSAVKDACWYFAATGEGRFLFDPNGHVRASDRRGCQGLLEDHTVQLYADEHMARELRITKSFGVPQADITKMMNDNVPPQPPAKKAA
ncbi:hypothetical protein J4207_05320 [Candidatus Woesearchaeota archaeon]|nr:hypothetical protein [Candidatus Woesearchaeota archaeon]